LPRSLHGATRNGMTVNILAVGSRGDVQPYIALGIGLREAGYHVRLITLPGFANMVQPFKLDHVEILTSSAYHVAATAPDVQDRVDSGGNFVASWRGFIRLFGHLGANGIRDTRDWLLVPANSESNGDHQPTSSSFSPLCLRQ
jgi:Glycosyltransferase family 28 N-terminal domain